MAGIVRALPSGGLSSGAPGAPRPSLEDSLKSLGSTLSEARGVAELGVAAPKTRDASTETPTHFVERHIDPRYHWNEWDMRRKMLRYADIKNSRTVSVQSHVSYFRRENDTQVYLPKESTTQTGISTGTNPVRVVRYIEGVSPPWIVSRRMCIRSSAVLDCVWCQGCEVERRLCRQKLDLRSPVFVWRRTQSTPLSHLCEKTIPIPLLCDFRCWFPNANRRGVTTPFPASQAPFCTRVRQRQFSWQHIEPPQTRSRSTWHANHIRT